MEKILTEISAGELLDKISILEIKLNKIKDHVLLNEVKKEYEILNETKNKNISFSEKIDILYKNLKSEFFSHNLILFSISHSFSFVPFKFL